METQNNSMTQAWGRQRFATTRWSLVLEAAQSAGSNPALSELCEAYWYPAYAFLRRSGYSIDKASDLTQAFFTRMIEKQFLKEARSERGRFRSFLLASLRHFALNEYDKERAQMRGGHSVHVPLDFGSGEDRYQREPPDDLTPEHIYEHQWTRELLDRAMAKVAAKYRRTGREAVFLRLRPYLTGDDPVPYRQLANQLGSTEGSLRVAVLRLRREFGTTLRATIAETVERPEDVDDELKYLLSVLCRRRD